MGLDWRYQAKAVCLYLIGIVPPILWITSCGDPLPREGAAASVAAPAGSNGERTQATAANLVWVSDVVFAETDDVLLVEPTFASDPNGHFLVGDRREAQARRFASDGTLLWAFGRAGEGPGEFTAVSAVRRLPSDSILVLDYRGRIAVLDSAGRDLQREFTVPLTGLEQLEVLDDSLVLLASRNPAEVDPPTLHVWNIRTNEAVVEFFRPYGRSKSPEAATTAGWTRFAVAGDTVAAFFSVVPSVFLFSTDGRLLDEIPFPSPHFRQVQAGSSFDSSRGMGGVTQWLASFDLIADIHWMSNHTLLVPYQQVRSDSARTRMWHLVLMSTDGNLLAEVRDTPPLYAVRGDTLWLQRPSSLLPNHLSQALLVR